jgi:hypothetical protein
MVVATIIPFFQPLLGFFGGFAYAPTTYFVSTDLHALPLWLNQISTLWVQSHDRNLFLDLINFSDLRIKVFKKIADMAIFIYLA